MKIQVISDIHAEFGTDYSRILDCKCDILVIAGDVNVGLDTLETLNHIQKEHISNPIILFVPGNHEYYNHSKYSLDQKLIPKNNNIKILNNDYFVYNNVVFLGSTGWFDESNGKIYFRHIESLNDFTMIKDIMFNNKGIDWGKECRKFFVNKLEEFSRYYNVVCISHHGPVNIVPRKYKYSKLNNLFCNDWKDLIEYYKPFYWIYGHTHKNMDFCLDKTRCICNPIGYPFEYNDYISNLVLKI